MIDISTGRKRNNLSGIRNCNSTIIIRILFYFREIFNIALFIRKLICIWICSVFNNHDVKYFINITSIRTVDGKIRMLFEIVLFHIFFITAKHTAIIHSVTINNRVWITPISGIICIDKNTAINIIISIKISMQIFFIRISMKNWIVCT